MGDMEKGQESDHFQLLGEKVESLIESMKSIKKENESLIEKIGIQEGKIADLTGEVENLKDDRNKAKQKIVSLLEKIEQLDI